ncbi:antibiotic biosynthesis monooxygenase family protein [Marinobacter sp. PE14]
MTSPQVTSTLVEEFPSNSIYLIGGEVIRVVYRWKVNPENFENFKEVWVHTTNNIHETVPGALGSFMLRSTENETEVVTVAKWDSVESWKRFWVSDNPSEMVGMRRIGERVSVTIYDEIDDFTR